MKIEIKDAETARKLARLIEALQRGEPLDRAAAYASLDRRAAARFLESVKDSLESRTEDADAVPERRKPQKPRRPEKPRKTKALPKKTKIARLTAFTDGASRGNPGEAACAMVLFDEKNEELLRRTKRLGVTTNNVAEYEGVLLAMEYAGALGARDLDIRLDSELVVRQLLGVYRVKSQDLLPFYQQAMHLARRRREFRVSHLPRELNIHADALANQALDAAPRGKPSHGLDAVFPG